MWVKCKAKTDVIGTYCAYVIPHAPEERLDVIEGGWADECAVVEDEADPEVVHEDGEAGHDGDDTPWSAKLVAV